MNINQMKSAISKFRKANLSVIKDEKLRAKAQKLQSKEKGFTLLELLIVITLIAILATGALIAYEGVGENAQAAAGANNAATIDRAIRTYKAVDGLYPNQWDSLVSQDASAVPFLPVATSNFVGAWSIAAANAENIAEALAESGIEEIQYIVDSSFNGGTGRDADVAPNRAHNESTNTNASEYELEDYLEDITANADDWPGVVSVVPNGVCAGIDGYPADTFGSTVSLSGVNTIQNSYADLLEGDECHAVIALGFGGDAAASTALSRVAIANSPTYNRDGIVDASTEYSRFVGLFLVASEGEDAAGDPTGAFEYLPSARLLAIVAPDGANIDQLNAEASND